MVNDPVPKALKVIVAGEPFKVYDTTAFGVPLNVKVASSPGQIGETPAVTVACKSITSTFNVTGSPGHPALVSTTVIAAVYKPGGVSPQSMVIALVP